MATHQKKHQKKKQPKFLEYTEKEEGEEYGEVISAKSSDARFEVNLIPTTMNIIAKPRGNLIKGPNKKKIEKGTIVLLQRDHTFTAEEKYFIIRVYTKDEVHRLQKSEGFKLFPKDSYVEFNDDVNDEDIIAQI